MHKFIIQINSITCCLFLMNSSLTIWGSSNESCASSCHVGSSNGIWSEEFLQRLLFAYFKDQEVFKAKVFVNRWWTGSSLLEYSLFKSALVKLKQMVVHSKFSSLRLHQNKSCREYLRSRFASNKFLVFSVKLHRRD